MQELLIWKKVTDYVEEVELSAQSMGEAMAMVHGRASEKAEAASVYKL